VATKLEGQTGQNLNKVALKSSATKTTGASTRGQTRRTQRFNQGVRDVKS